MIEVKAQSLARVVQIMGAMNDQENAKDPKEIFQTTNNFDGDDVDDDLVFSTVPQRSTTTNDVQIHFDEIDDDEMRRFAESLEQEENQGDDERLCEDYAKKMQTPTKSVQIESNKRKKRSLEDLDALLDDDENSNEYKSGSNGNSSEQVSPVFKKKP